MRESIGGTWLLGFVVLFIVLFSAYLAYSINYTKAFKTKNFIINTIEENEGFKTSTSDMNTMSVEELTNSRITEEKIFGYLTENGYKTSLDESKCANLGSYRQGGYCIMKIYTDNGAYYKVTTFITIEVPLIWQKFTIPIKGETRVIYNVNDGFKNTD